MGSDSSQQTIAGGTYQWKHMKEGVWGGEGLGG